MANTKPQKHFAQGLKINSLPIRERVSGFVEEISGDANYHGFDTYALKEGVKLLEVEPNRTVWEMRITPHLCNKSGNLHGGAAATLMDNLTSMALLTLTAPGYLDAGHVSRTITMSYLRPVPEGSLARIECQVQTAGRTMGNIEGKLYVNGKLAVTCIHDKVIFQSQTKAKL